MICAGSRLAPEGCAGDRSRICREPGLQRDRLGVGASELHAVVFGRIVRCRNHHAAVESVFADGEVERVGRDHADVRYVGAGLRRAARKGLEELLARRAHVAPDHDCLAPTSGTKQRPMP